MPPCFCAKAAFAANNVSDTAPAAASALGPCFIACLLFSARAFPPVVACCRALNWASGNTSAPREYYFRNRLPIVRHKRAGTNCRARRPDPTRQLPPNTVLANPRSERQRGSRDLVQASLGRAGCARRGIGPVKPLTRAESDFYGCSDQPLFRIETPVGGGRGF